MCHNPTLYMYKYIYMYYQYILLEGAGVKLPLKLPSSSLRRCNNDAVVMSFKNILVVQHNQTGMWSAVNYNNLHSGILVENLCTCTCMPCMCILLYMHVHLHVGIQVHVHVCIYTCTCIQLPIYFAICPFRCNGILQNCNA